ncbi:MAG: hypothetical protein D6767_07000 [Candidatus Hydrogenedentota bacterium]|nr:MAG: hypothetical protein D6767_07000 [Candidatus Hydrogenedentota bacterium]
MFGYALSILTFVLGIVLFMSVHKKVWEIFKQHNIKARAMVKYISLREWDPEQDAVLTKFLTACILISLSPCFFIASLTWATDYSFLIVLFPLLWYYYLVRYFFWEKEDLEDKKKKPEQKKA